MPGELPEVGPWARDKLDRLAKYLARYTAIMTKQKWAKGYLYVDAFAGAGRTLQRRGATGVLDEFLVAAGARDPEQQTVLDGSPLVALQVEPPFTHYVFVERDPARLERLRSLRDEWANRRTVLVRQGDCNTYLQDKLIGQKPRFWNRWRGVVFLDPFGAHVPWTTLQGLADTSALEVFINFPVGMAIQRLLKRSGNFSTAERTKLDVYFGDAGWFDVVYEKSVGLFEDSMLAKAEDAATRLVAWYRSRLASAFGYVSAPHLVRNSRGGHLYYLLFAGPNETGAKIANHVLSVGSAVRAPPRPPARSRPR